LQKYFNPLQYDQTTRPYPAILPLETKNIHVEFPHHSLAWRYFKIFSKLMFFYRAFNFKCFWFFNDPSQSKAKRTFLFGMEIVVGPTMEEAIAVSTPNF
jgi:hypothetical protein